MLRGRVVAELDPATVTPAELGSYMTGADGMTLDGSLSRRIASARLARPAASAAVVAIVVSSIALLIAGKSPITAFKAMW